MNTLVVELGEPVQLIDDPEGPLSFTAMGFPDILVARMTPKRPASSRGSEAL
jgi:hypothetical protein